MASQLERGKSQRSGKCTSRSRRLNFGGREKLFAPEQRVAALSRVPRRKTRNRFGNRRVEESGGSAFVQRLLQRRKPMARQTDRSSRLPKSAQNRTNQRAQRMAASGCYTACHLARRGAARSSVAQSHPLDWRRGVKSERLRECSGGACASTRNPCAVSLGAFSPELPGR